MYFGDFSAQYWYVTFHPALNKSLPKQERACVRKTFALSVPRERIYRIRIILEWHYCFWEEGLYRFFEWFVRLRICRCHDINRVNVHTFISNLCHRWKLINQPRFVCNQRYYIACETSLQSHSFGCSNLGVHGSSSAPTANKGVLIFQKNVWTRVCFGSWTW